MALARECIMAGTGRKLIVFHQDRKWGKITGSGERGEQDMGPGYKTSKPFLYEVLPPPRLLKVP